MDPVEGPVVEAVLEAGTLSAAVRVARQLDQVVSDEALRSRVQRILRNAEVYRRGLVRLPDGSVRAFDHLVLGRRHAAVA